MRRLIITISSLAFAGIAPAQQALQCVNPDVLNSLVFNARADARLTISRTIPANTTGFRAPSGFTLIGTGVRGPQFPSTVVAYKTTLARDKAFDSLLGFLSDDGWSREVSQQVQLPTVTVAGAQPSAATLCRNGERRNIQVQEVEGVRYATIAGSATIPARACGVPVPQQGFSGNPMAAMEAARGIMPQFSLPETARNIGQDGSDFGGNGLSSSMRIQSPDPAATLARHLGRQLQEQGWRGDAEWKGTLSTGSTWLRSNGAGQPYWLTLEILSVDNGIYEIGYSMATRPR
ncbi:MAG: hypothetical protein ABI645_13485 [Pseudomonadota bacterium]